MSARLRHLAALAIFCAAFAGWFHGVAAHPGSRISCCIGDGAATIRDYWVASAQQDNPLTFTHDTYNGAPEGTDRAVATTVANGGAQTAFVWGLKGVFGLVGAWNAFLAVGLVGTALATFALLDLLGCTFLASVFGGYVFGFSPYALERAYAGQLGLLQNWSLVLPVFALLRLRERRTPSSAAILGATVALAFYVSAYQALFASVTVVAFGAVDLLRAPSHLARARYVALVAGAYALCFALLAPVFVLYAREHSTVQAATAHASSDLYTFAARISDYYLPSPRNPLFHWVGRWHALSLTENTLFFGYLTAVLAVAGMVLLRRRNAWLAAGERRWAVALSTGLLVPLAFLLSLPPTYHAGPVTIPTASKLLGAFTNTWRDYARFGALFGLGLAVLASLALSALAQREGRAWRAAGATALAVAVVELLPGNAGVLDTTRGPAWVTWLAGQPRGIVATYPVTLHQGPALNLRLAQYWYQVLDRDPGFEIVGETYLQARTRQQAVRTLALDLGNPRTASILTTEGVRYVVVDRSVYAQAGEPLPSLNPAWYTRLVRLGAVSVYSVHAPQVDIQATIDANAAEIVGLQGGLLPG